MHQLRDFIKFGKVEDYKINMQIAIVFLYSIDEQTENEIKGGKFHIQ